VGEGEEGVVPWWKGGGFVDGISAGFVFYDGGRETSEGDVGLGRRG